MWWMKVDEYLKTKEEIFLPTLLNNSDVENWVMTNMSHAKWNENESLSFEIFISPLFLLQIVKYIYMLIICFLCQYFYKWKFWLKEKKAAVKKKKEI
jgi:hypothetical protein